jgi:hypothetical protein
MIGRIAALFACGFLVTGCATITTGTSHNLTVVTEPPGATCELRRGDEIIGAVNPTPGSVRISKSTRDVIIRCRREGMADAVVTLSPEFQAMTLGNILIGGVVGIVVDAASGAAGRYPNSVTLSMAPPGGNAPNAPDIDSLSARIEALRSLCAPAERARCESEIARLEAERARRAAPTS